jgi:hypothetical protein
MGSAESAREIVRLSIEAENEHVRAVCGEMGPRARLGYAKEYDPNAEGQDKRPPFDPKQFTMEELQQLYAGGRTDRQEVGVGARRKRQRMWPCRQMALVGPRQNPPIFPTGGLARPELGAQLSFCRFPIDADALCRSTERMAILACQPCRDCLGAP